MVTLGGGDSNGMTNMACKMAVPLERTAEGEGTRLVRVLILELGAGHMSACFVLL